MPVRFSLMRRVGPPLPAPAPLPRHSFCCPLPSARNNFWVFLLSQFPASLARLEAGTGGMLVPTPTRIPGLFEESVQESEFEGRPVFFRLSSWLFSRPLESPVHFFPELLQTSEGAFVDFSAREPVEQ